MSAQIDRLLENPAIWRIGDLRSAGNSALERAGWATGHAALDAELPEGGWPARGMAELLYNDMGIGEISLLAPTLAAMAKDNKGTVWVNPPYLPYAPALAAAGIDLAKMLVVRAPSVTENLWAAEQALRSGAASAVLLWLNQHVDYASLRRLHIAGEAGDCTAFVYRAASFVGQSSPAPLRVALVQQAGRLGVRIVKRRGLMASREMLLDTTANRWPQMPTHAGTAPARMAIAAPPQSTQPLYPARLLQPAAQSTAQPAASELARVLPFLVPGTARHASQALAR